MIQRFWGDRVNN